MVSLEQLKKEITLLQKISEDIKEEALILEMLRTAKVTMELRRYD